MLSLILATACKPPTPSEQLESVLSWIGTAGMAGSAWLRHTTPDTYTRQTLELSHEKLGQLADDLLKFPPPGIDSASINSVLASMWPEGTRFIGGLLEGGIAGGDDRGVFERRLARCPPESDAERPTPR